MMIITFESTQIFSNCLTLVVYLVYSVAFLSRNHLAISLVWQNSTSSPHPFTHPNNRSTIPITCAMPLVSGCISTGKMGSSSFSRIHRNRSRHKFSITRTSVYPCELGTCGRNCMGVMSSMYQLQGTQTRGRRSSRAFAPALGIGCIQVDAGWEKSIGWRAGRRGAKKGWQSWSVRDASGCHGQYIRSIFMSVHL